MADELSQASKPIQLFDTLIPYVDSEPALGIPKSLVQHQISQRVNNKDKEYWRNIPGNKNGNTFIKNRITDSAEQV